MRLTDEMLSITTEELSLAIVEADWKVSADIFVTDHFAAESCDKALHIFSGANTFELNRLPFGQFGFSCDWKFLHRQKTKSVE